MQALKIISKVKNGKTSIDHIPEEFGNEVEVIILPIQNSREKQLRKTKKSLLDLAGKKELSSDIYTQLENGRNEDRF